MAINNNLQYSLSGAQVKDLASRVNNLKTKAGAPTTATVGTVGQLLADTTNGKLYICTAVTGDGGDPEVFTYTWVSIATGSVPNVVQTIGTSNTNVMSQLATSDMIYADPANKRGIRIGESASPGSNNGVAVGSYANAFGTYSLALGGAPNGSSLASATGDYSVAVGSNASTNKNYGVVIGYGAEQKGGVGSVSLGAYSKTTKIGEVNVGSTSTSYGYNSTNYRLVTGVHDPVSAHDAATKGYVDSVAGGGLITLSYGNSTWQDFLDAYNAGEIVYCRASSAADPSSGDQTRMAFMAYVNNPTTPTEVEFQYVRSVSSKTAAQPCDQVFVYKLTSVNGGTWTVETRNVTYKVAAGTNVTTSYSSGTVTINADAPVITMTSTDPGEGGALAANNFIAVYDAS